MAEKPVPYGREIRAASINQLLSATGGTVDEDALYRQAARQLGRRWLRSVSRPVAHGTHVMDLACGYDLTEAERGKRPIVCVQLPEATTADTSGENLDSYVLDGIRYILERADEIARRVPGREHLPVVINFSYGNVAGPHDGTSDLESAIDELIQKRRAVASLQPLEVVIPSGNSHLGRLHASIPFKAAGETVDLHWRVLPDDRTPSFLEIWLPPGSPAREGNSRIKLAIATPGRLRSTSLDDTKPDGWLDDTKPGAGLQLLSDHGEVLCEVRYRYVGKPTDRGMFLIALQPTRSNELAANPIAPSGTWIVTLENTRPEAYPVEAWIQRDDTPYGFPRRGRQSYFDEACYQRFFDVPSKDRLEHKDRPDKVQGQQIDDDDDQMDCIIKRAGSINAIATGRETIVVGGYLRKEMRVARYSAGGPKERASPWKRDGPDALEVSDDSTVHRGVLAAGTRSGSVVAMNGTSVAAPQVTRLVADELAKGKSAQVGQQAARGRDTVKKRAQRDELKHPHGKRPSNERGGAGRIMRPQDVQMHSLMDAEGRTPEGSNRWPRTER